MFSDITPAKIGFIGLGLIGGSVAKAIRTYFPDYELIAFDKNKETLALAVQENIIDTSCSAIDDNFKGSKLYFLMRPRFIQHRLPYPAKISDRSRLYFNRCRKR